MDTLSAHFYSYDCLAAMLLDSLMNNNEELAFLVASELVENSSDVFFKVLCLAWWLQSPGHPLQAARHKAFLEQNSHSLFSALVGNSFELPQLVIPTVKPNMTVKAALKKRNYEQVYAYAAQMDDDSLKSLGIHDAYLDARRSAVYKPLEMRILYHACSALTAYAATPPPCKPWVFFPPGKAGRIFRITDMPCALWGVKPPPAENLRGDPRKLIQVPSFETEDHEIEFYKTQFPDDIPDEWSDSEIVKSHDSRIIEYIKNPWRAAFYDCF